MDTKTELISMCNRIAKEVESGEYEMDERDVEEWDGPCAGHYLSEALDVEYTVSSRGQYLGEGIAETRKKIESGVYKLVDLNRSKRK